MKYSHQVCQGFLAEEYDGFDVHPAAERRAPQIHPSNINWQALDLRGLPKSPGLEDEIGSSGISRIHRRSIRKALEQVGSIHRGSPQDML